MSRSILFILCLIFLVASVSGYGAYVNCPDQVMIGKALKCSVDSDFPAGTTFDLIFSDPQSEVSRQTVYILENKGTQYKLFDTTGLQSGEYFVTIKFSGTNTPVLRSDSITRQDFTLISGSVNTTKTTTIPSATSSPIIELTTIQPTSQTTVSPIITINVTPTKSVEQILKEQNEKIDAQNILIAEQNKKIEAQNDILNQILAKIKGIFGWN